MPRINALHVALKDRPKAFKAVVLSLIAFNLSVVVLCGLAALQNQPKRSQPVAKKELPASRPAYASFLPAR